MLKITVCIGSSCHIKGSRQVVEQLQYLIAENNLGDKVELGGTFCMGITTKPCLPKRTCNRWTAF